MSIFLVKRKNVHVPLCRSGFEERKTAEGGRTRSMREVALAVAAHRLGAYLTGPGAVENAGKSETEKPR